MGLSVDELRTNRIRSLLVMTDAERTIELELELMAQRELLNVLNAELTQSNEHIEKLEKRTQRLEQQVEDLLKALDAPPVERPPHY